MVEHHERREFNSEMFVTLTKISGDIGQIKGTLEALGGPVGRVTALEESLKTAEKRQWLHSVVVIPIVGALHLIARKIGL